MQRKLCQCSPIRKSICWTNRFETCWDTFSVETASVQPAILFIQLFNHNHNFLLFSVFWKLPSTWHLFLECRSTEALSIKYLCMRRRDCSPFLSFMYYFNDKWPRMEEVPVSQRQKRKKQKQNNSNKNVLKFRIYWWYCWWNRNTAGSNVLLFGLFCHHQTSWV